MMEPALAIQGAYRDVLRNVAGVLVYDSGWVTNKIVNRCHVLLAAFMRGDAEYVPLGIQYLAFGRGSDGWDATPPPPPPGEDDTALVDEEEYRVGVEDLELSYLDVLNAEQPTPSSRIQIKVTLEPGKPPPEASGTYPLREFGLFGRLRDPEAPDDAEEDVKNPPYMINSVRHAVIHKEPDTTLERFIRLYF